MRFSDLKGSTSEYKAHLWLEKEYPLIRVVETNHFSNLDRRGIDLIGMVGETVVLCAQVKSSVEGADAFMKHHAFDDRMTVIVCEDGKSPYFYHKGKILV